MLSELCVRRPVFATMLVMSLVVLGLFSFRLLGVDLFPRADPATVNVSLSLPGASPDEISSSGIEPMEEAISGVSGIDEISARINEGRGNITVRFVLERDLNDAANDVREKVAGAIRNVPPTLLPPVITKVDPDADPVMSLIVSSKGMSLRTLTELADKQVARSIQTVNGVGQVTVGGGRAREIHVVVDIEKLNSYGLSLTQVRDAIVAENVEVPGGTVEQGKGQLLLRTLGRIDATEDFGNIVVATRNGTPIRVSDIGYAEDAEERPTTAVWMGDTPAVMLDIRRAMGENTVSVIEGVRDRLKQVQRSLPPSVTLTVIRDDSRFIYASVASLEEHLIMGSLFAAVVVMLFIRNIRAVLIASLADVPAAAHLSPACCMPCSFCATRCVPPITRTPPPAVSTEADRMARPRSRRIRRSAASWAPDRRLRSEAERWIPLLHLAPIAFDPREVAATAATPGRSLPLPTKGGEIAARDTSRAGTPGADARLPRERGSRSTVAPRANSRGKNGGPCRIRTCDFDLVTIALYQLS